MLCSIYHPLSYEKPQVQHIETMFTSGEVLGDRKMHSRLCMVCRNGPGES